MNEAKRKKVADNVKPPQMVSVKSSNIAKVGYDEASKSLWVLFHNKSLYVYAEVPKRIAAGMVDAKINGDSVGKYFAQYVKDTYSWDRVEPSKFFTAKMPDPKTAD